MTMTKQDQADAAVKAAETELAEKERALAAGEQLLAETEADAVAAGDRKREADPFDEKDYLKRAQAETLAAAKLDAMTARVNQARASTESARARLAEARFTRDCTRLEAMHQAIVDERGKTEETLRRVAGELVDALRKLNALAGEARRFRSSIALPSPLDQTPPYPWHKLDSVAEEALRARSRLQAHGVLFGAVDATWPAPEPEPVPDWIQQQTATGAAAEDRRIRRMVQDFADEEAWKEGRRIALEQRRARGEERRVVLSDETPNPDYTPRIG